MRLPRLLVAHMPARAVADRDAAPIGRGLEREDPHPANFTRPERLAFATTSRAQRRSKGTIERRSRHDAFHASEPLHRAASARFDAQSRPSLRSTRKGAASRASTARRSSSRARCRAKSSTITTLKRKPTYEIARAETIVKASAARVSTALPAFRRLRRLLAAALRCRARRSRPSSARSRTRCGTSAACAPAQMLPAIHGPAWALPAPRAALGAPRREERRRAGRLPRAQVELRRRHDVVRDPAAQDLRLAARAARAGRGTDDARPPAADRARGRATAPATRASCSCCGFSRRSRGSDEAALARVRRSRTACSSICSPADPRRRRRFQPAARSSPTRCRNSISSFPFSPTEFTQVNPAINRVLVRRAIALLDPRPGERVADFFCGIGNFTLPIARRGATVVGIEGSAALVRRAEEIAAVNGLAELAQFRVDQPVRRHARGHRGAGPARQGAHRSAARGRDRAREGAAAATARRSGSSTCPAIPRRSRATRRCWSTTTATSSPPPASSTCSRTPRTSSRSRCSRGEARQKKRGNSRRPVSRCWCTSSRAAPRTRGAGSTS